MSPVGERLDRKGKTSEIKGFFHGRVEAQRHRIITHRIRKSAELL